MPIIEKEFLDLTEQLDPSALWEENRRCEAFTPDKPRCFFPFSPDDHWLFEFLDVESIVAVPVGSRLPRHLPAPRLQQIGRTVATASRKQYVVHYVLFSSPETAVASGV
jgi:hypothetical protein